MERQTPEVDDNLMAERGWLRRPPVFAPSDFKAAWKDEVSNHVYHGQWKAVSSSQLKHVLVSPKTYEWYCLKSPPKEDTPALRFGRLFHMALLEPEKFTDSVKVQRTKPKGEVFKKDRIPIAEDDYSAIGHMKESCYNNELVKALLREGHRERSGFYRDERTGLACRIRPDLIWDTEDWIVDVKTVREASLYHFRRDIEQYRYDLSAAMYLEGASAITGRPFTKFIWLVVQKVPPYEVITVPMHDKYHATGVWDYHKGMDILARTVKTLEFPGIGAEAQTLEPSHYFYERYLADENEQFEEGALEND